MDPLVLSWQILGAFLGALIGRQFVVLTLRQRQASIDSGLDWPFEWQDSVLFRWWATGLGFGLTFLIIVFGWWVTLLGTIVGVPLAYLARNLWKISTETPDFVEDTYQGD